MEKESWLDPICSRDLIDFASQQSNIKEVKAVGFHHGECHGKVWTIVAKIGRRPRNVYFTQFAFVLDVSPTDIHFKDGNKDYDEYAIRNVMEKGIFAGRGCDGLQDFSLWSDWITFVEQKNEGRKINGLTYEEDLNLRIREYFDAKKEKGYKKVDAEIKNMEDTLLELCPQLQLTFHNAENLEYDFSDMSPNNSNSDKTDIRNK